MKRGPTDGEGFIAVQGEGNPCVRGGAHHVFVAKWLKGCLVLVEGAVEFLIHRFCAVFP